MVDEGYDAINEALDRCGDLGFEMVPGFATHWAMGSETMIALGRPDLVPTWVELYKVKHKHYERPDAADKIDGTNVQNWRAALGAFERAGDWQQFFDRELTERPWQDVVTEWWPRLMPGVGAGLTHGLIRTVHIIRSFMRSPDESPTPAQLRELATGLSYWAGRYVEQPGVANLFGEAQLPRILDTVPRVDPNNGIKLQDKGLFLHMPDVDGWPDAVGQLSPPVDVPTGISDLTLAFAQVNLVHADQFPIPLVHTVTAPAALRLMLPLLPEELHMPSYVSVWRAAAALLSTFAPPGRAAESDPAFRVDDHPPLTVEELRARAVDHGDEHALKYTEACLREYALRPDDRYLFAAEQMQRRIPRYFRAAKSPV